MNIELGDGERSVKRGDTLYVFDPLMKIPFPFDFDSIIDHGWVKCKNTCPHHSTLTTGFQDFYTSPPSKFYWDPDACLDAEIIGLLQKRTNFQQILAKEVDRHSPVG